MEDSSMSVTKTMITRRKMMSVANDSEFEPNLHRYQIYRGLSPDTSNRLEIKIQSLEEELQSERQARIAAQQQATYLSEEIQLQSESFGEFEGKLLNHNEIVKVKDQEIAKLRHDYEALLEKNESGEIVMKKKYQETVNALNEQLEHLNKQKSRLETDKKNIITEVGELSSNLEKMQTSKAHLEAKLESYENDFRRIRIENEEHIKQLQDAINLKSKAIHENSELQSRIKHLESTADALTRDKQKLLRDLDTLKSTLDEAEAEKPHLIISLNNLQLELSDARSTLEEEQQHFQLAQAQLQKLQSEMNALKIKYDKDLAAYNEENEAIRKKYVGRVAELEDALSIQQKKASKLEKEHNRLVIEIREIIDDLEKSKASSADLSKKLKQSESSCVDQRYQIDQLTANLQVSENNITKLQSEINTMKTAMGGKDDRYEALARELKSANDKAKEFKQLGDETKVQVQDLLNVKATLERDIAKLTGVVTDFDKKLVESRRCLEVSISEAKQIKEDLTGELRLKDGEIENLKKTSLRQTDELSHRLVELESRHKSEMTRTKKLVETEMLELSASHDAATKASAELSRANKSLANRVKELESQLQNEERMKEDLAGQLNNAERKRISLHNELEQACSKIEATEHVRKMAEMIIGELEQKVAELTLTVAATSNEARRHESDANSLRATVEDANLAKREVEERNEKLRYELENITEALNLQMELAQEKESNMKLLEKDLRDAREALDEIEQRTLRDGKKLLSKVQSRCKSLEIDLDTEQRKARDFAGENRKLQRLVQEMIASKENDSRELAERTGQLESTLASAARLKKQLIEAEEVITVVTSKYRRLQHQFDEEASDREQRQATTIVVSSERGAQLAAAGGSAHSLSHLHHHHGVQPLQIANATAARISIARSVTSSSVNNRLHMA